MKKVKAIFGALLFVPLILTSCGGEADDKKEVINSEVIKTEDTLKANVDSLFEPVENIEPANVSCKLYFLGIDFTDEETGEATKGTMMYKEDFNTKKITTFCYDSEDFHHLTLVGSGKKLSFIIKAGNKQVFKEEEFDLEDKLTFTSKDFNFVSGNTYSIIIKQNETIIFNGKIESQQCM